MEFVLIPAGSFMMGSSDSDSDAPGDERPLHQVTITKPFYLGKYEVTQEQWQTVMGSNPSNFKGPKNPVERVNWDDCQAFVAKLNERYRKNGTPFALPTEAQWEYACRAGSATRFSYGQDDAALQDYAWLAEDSADTTHPVGLKKPNAWALHDMNGNVWEWCADWYGPDYYRHSPGIDPAGPSDGSLRVLRGGSINDHAQYRLVTFRGRYQPSSRLVNLGFRVAGTYDLRVALAPKPKTIPLPKPPLAGAPATPPQSQEPFATSDTSPTESAPPEPYPAAPPAELDDEKPLP